MPTRKLILSYIFLHGLLLAIPAQALPLTEQEQQYLAGLDEIRICTDPDWLPYEGIDQDEHHIGIMSDFHQLWADKIGINVTLVPTQDWTQSLEYIQTAKCDILSSAQDVPDRRHYLAITDPFIFYPLAIAAQPDNLFVINLEQVIDREFAMVEGYASIDILKRMHPKLNVLEVTSALEGLKLVEKGQVYGYIDTVPTINYQMLRHGISHLKISGVLDEQYAMSIGIGRHAMPLQSIYNKAIANTTELERQKILKNWLSVTVHSNVNFTLIWQVGLIALVLLAVLYYRYRIVQRHNKRLKHINAELSHMSHNDQLTGIANRYRLHQRLNQEMKSNRVTHHSFSIMLIDVDNFKMINDEYGHAVGDQVIQEVANLLTAMIRDQDLVGRWGGEEFLIICPQTSQQGALQLAEQIRQQVQQHDFVIEGQMTVSIGVSEYIFDEDVSTCLKRADDALYLAKNRGRNQTVLAPVAAES